MDMELVKPLLAGFARHALTTFGGYLVASGVIGSGQVEGLVGAGLVILGVAWSWWQKVGQDKVAGLLKKMTNHATVKGAVEAAEGAPTPVVPMPTTSKFANSGTSPADAAKVTGILAAAAFVGLLLLTGSASAQSRGGANLPFDPLHINDKTKALAGPDASSVATLFAKPFQDLANFVGDDAGGAISLSTQIPTLQDGHGQQCWMAMSDFGAVVKAHPIPLTLHLMTDVESFRLLAMAANKVCSNVHCTQVFADVSTAVQQAAPINPGIGIPSLHDLCSKIPEVAVVPPVADAAAPVTPAPAGGSK